MEIQRRREWIGKLAVFAALGSFLSACTSRTSPAAESKQQKRYVKNQRAQSRSYSQAVVTQGGTTIWLAGQTGASDSSGKVLDFEGQVRQVFTQFGQTLKEAGGQLSDIVTMTVFITDMKNGDKFVSVRHEIFGDNFPASALIGISALALPEALVEVQAVAVVG